LLKAPFGVIVDGGAALAHLSPMLLFSHRLVLPLTVVVCALQLPSFAQQAVGELYASDASVKGSVILANSGTTVLSGSSIKAGAQAATLKLDRGGSVLVCEGTNLSVASSRSGRELLFSLNAGNLELNYLLGTEADRLLTPDFQLMLPGPGTVHVAVRVTPQGDTCVQSLPSNVSAIVVSESMGDATYQVKPDEAVLFRGGHLTQASRSVQNCGCPAPPPVQTAKATPPPVSPAQPKPVETVPAAPAPPDQHIAVEAPFIFHGNDPAPDLSANVAVLKLENNKIIPLQPTVLPPASAKQQAPSNPQTAKKESHGLFSKVGAFFASIFH
jgi:hypothetical protein